MQYGIAFTPLVPSFVLWVALAAIAVIAVLLLLSRARGAAVRVTALALILLALANPSFTREDREPLSSVAAVVIDKSPSQNFGQRSRKRTRRRKRSSTP
jgi:membrane protein implicated in regulation of membrane protease activity